MKNKSLCSKPQGKLTGYILDKFWMNKEKLTRAGLEPATSGLSCRRLYQLSYLALHGWSPYIVIIFVRGVPVRSHETIYCPLARDHAKVTIQPGKRQ